MDVKSLALTYGGVAFLVIVGIFLVVPIINASIIWYKTGNKIPFIDSTAGAFFLAEKDIATQTAKLDNKELANVARVFIIKDLFVVAGFYYLLSKLYFWAMGKLHTEGAWAQFWIYVPVTLMTLAFLEFIYILVAHQEAYIPGTGIASLIKVIFTNPQILSGINLNPA